MAFAHEPFYNQNSVLKISVMVVDDDPVFLQIMSHMLEKSICKDPSLMEITVLIAKNSMEALSTLKIHRNNIDLIITDYYMPDMNGIQLKQQITQEFGNLPVIVMSSDTNKEEESLTCGAMCFIPKPIKPNDLTKIYQYAITYKRNGKSIILTEQNHKDTDVTVPQQIEALPGVANVMVETKKKKKKYSSARSDSRSVNTNGSDVIADGSRKHQKRKPIDGSGDDDDDDDDDEPRPSKKDKITWTGELHDLFLQAIRHIGLDKAVPKRILEFMNIPHLTRENIASHLQKYRIFLRKVADQGMFHSNLLPIRSNRGPYYNYYTPSTSWYETGLNNRSFYTKPGHGLGQSRLLSNTREPVRFNQQTSPYNYVNRSFVYEPQRIGSNLTLPIKSSNLSISNQPSQNEGPRGVCEANKTAQTSQVIGFGQTGPSSINGNSVNNNMASSYGSLTTTQPGLTSYGSSSSRQPGLGSFARLPPNQPRVVSSFDKLFSNQSGVSSYGSSTSNQAGQQSSNGSLTPNQPRVSSFGSLTPNQSRVSSFGNLTPNQSGPSSFGSLTPTQPAGLNSYGSLTPNQPGLSTYRSLTPNQSAVNSFGSLTPIQPGPSNFESLTPIQPGPSNFEILTPNEPASSSFSFDMQSFLNNEDEAYKPSQPHANANTQPNLEIPQLENLDIFDDLGSINELAFESSNNLQLDQNKPQGEDNFSNFDLHDLPTPLNPTCPIEEDIGGDWTFVNINQDHLNGEISNSSVVPETDFPIININPTNQEQEAPDYIDWGFLDRQDLVGDDFMDYSPFNNDMN